jgi:cell wall-associated NlpC family hydrolase
MFIVGGYLIWFGVHYWGTDVKWPSSPVKSALTGSPIPGQSGKDPSLSATLTADVGALQPDSSTTTSTTTTTGTSTGSAIADDALKYVGAGYVFGGNASKVGDWDCSSFVSYVLGHDLGQPLPGGKWGDPGFPPNSHGPASGTYALFGTGIDLTEVKAGDLIANGEHIGIAISSTQMISAQDPQLGTGIANFPAGFPGGAPSYRRISNA